MIQRLTVFVEGLALEAEIGLYPHERGRTQPLIVSVELELTPAATPDIHHAVNYETLVAKARALAGAEHIELVETFAERLAADCLDHPRALTVTVRVGKPQAITGAAAAGVELVISRGT